MPHTQVLSPSSTPSSRGRCQYPRNGRGMMMVLPDVRQRGRNSRIAMRRWSSRMKMMNPLPLPKVRPCVLIFRLVLKSHRHSFLNNTASLCAVTLYKLATRSDRRCSVRPVPAVRSLLSMHPPCLCQPLPGSDTGDCNLFKSLHPQPPMPPVSPSKWHKFYTRRHNWLEWPKKTWTGLP